MDYKLSTKGKVNVYLKDIKTMIQYGQPVVLNEAILNSSLDYKKMAPKLTKEIYFKYTVKSFADLSKSPIKEQLQKGDLAIVDDGKAVKRYRYMGNSWDTFDFDFVDSQVLTFEFEGTFTSKKLIQEIPFDGEIVEIDVLMSSANIMGPTTVSIEKVEGNNWVPVVTPITVPIYQPISKTDIANKVINKHNFLKVAVAANGSNVSEVFVLIRIRPY